MSLLVLHPYYLGKKFQGCSSRHYVLMIFLLNSFEKSWKSLKINGNHMKSLIFFDLANHHAIHTTKKQTHLDQHPIFLLLHHLTCVWSNFWSCFLPCTPSPSINFWKNFDLYRKKNENFEKKISLWFFYLLEFSVILLTWHLFAKLWNVAFIYEIRFAFFFFITKISHEENCCFFEKCGFLQILKARDFFYILWRWGKKIALHTKIGVCTPLC